MNPSRIVILTLLSDDLVVYPFELSMRLFWKRMSDTESKSDHAEARDSLLQVYLAAPR